MDQRFLVIYVYYEIKNYQKNKTNLSFFIRHSLNKNNWKNLNIEYLFIINGFQCEVLIPNEPHINVLRENNCSDWEGYANGIKYMENKYNKPIYELYNYIFFMN